MLRSIYAFLLGNHGFQMTEENRRKAALVLGLSLFVLLAAVVGLLGAWAVMSPSADSPAWENALQARLMLLRVKVAIGLLAGVVVAAYGLFQMLDRTRVGKRLLHWDPTQDTEYSSAAKTLNSGMLFAALMLGASLLAAGVLR
jgi:hypothetical protein